MQSSGPDEKGEGWLSNCGESEIQGLLRRLGTNPDKGLSEIEADSRLRRFGTNELERPYLRFRWVRLAALFCLAMGIVFKAEGAPWHALGAATLGVVLVVLASALLGHYRHAVTASGDPVPCVCMGIRGGRLQHLPVYKLVPGDIVRIRMGDIVPADGRLTEAVNLEIQEKALSGSSQPVEKDALHPSDPAVPFKASKNHVFMNTVVIRGRGTFVVTQTGKNTQIGRIRVLAHAERSGEG